MNVSFILPGYTRRPIGGYKIIFEYANRLVKHGFNVNIIFLNNDRLKNKHIPKVLKKYLINIITQQEPKWFELSPKIKKVSYINNNYTTELKADIAIATAVETVIPTSKIFPTAKKIYMIQDLEDWNVDKNYLHMTYNARFKNIVIAKWLKRIVDQYSNNESIYIRNPIDVSVYKVENSIENRERYTIGMLYHSAQYKGSKATFEAIKSLKKQFPKLKIIMFGTCEPPEDLPNWVEYHENATQAQTVSIYNKISVFVSGSIREGFGLTGLEAMACGAALVTTDYDGAKEYAVNEVNSLISPVKKWGALANNVSLLLKDNDMRIRLAKKGIDTAQAYSWSAAYNKFENAILH